jgi:putative transposase
MIILNDWFKTCNYLYNKTIHIIRTGEILYFDSNKLRDMLVTKRTKKNNPEYMTISNEILKMHTELRNLRKQKKLKDTNKEEIDQKIIKLENEVKLRNTELREIAKTLEYEDNPIVKDWQTKTPKKIRSDAVDDVSKAYTSAIANLKAGNISDFSVKFRKFRDNTSLSIPDISLDDNKINLVKKLKNEYGEVVDIGFNISKEVVKKLKNTEFKKTVRLVRKKGMYYIMVPIKNEKNEESVKNLRYCGIDPGCRTFLTSVGNSNSVEYDFKTELINNIDKKISLLKNKQLSRPRPHLKSFIRPIRKKTFNKLEIKKSNYVDELHWKSIKHILDNNDIVFIGDIKSHDIVKNKEHQSKLNRDINNLKFYIFKQRLLYKSRTRNKYTFLIPEPYTTKTCSCCGHINNPEKSKIYNCMSCKITMGRDLNAAKNILLKGLKKLDIV